MAHSSPRQGSLANMALGAGPVRQCGSVGNSVSRRGRGRGCYRTCRGSGSTLSTCPHVTEGRISRSLEELLQVREGPHFPPTLKILFFPHLTFLRSWMLSHTL